MFLLSQVNLQADRVCHDCLGQYGRVSQNEVELVFRQCAIAGLKGENNSRSAIATSITPEDQGLAIVLPEM